MKLIPITSPVDYFEITTNFGQDVWTFVFRWNETYGLFHVDVLLNRKSHILSIAVLGGVFVLNNFNLGYNFLFLGTVTKVSDLGTKMLLYQISAKEALKEGLINAQFES